MDWCREDATKENDGDRLVRLWRFDFLRFTLTNHTKYRLLAFKLQAQLMALLPPKLAHELKNNRYVNIHGGTGGNLTPAAIQRCGRSLQCCNTIVDGYTIGLEQFFGKPSNSTPSLKKDINMLVEVLKSEQLFKNVPGRQHRSFPAIEFDVISQLNANKLNSWLTGKK